MRGGIINDIQSTPLYLCLLCINAACDALLDNYKLHASKFSDVQKGGGGDDWGVFMIDAWYFIINSQSIAVVIYRRVTDVSGI